MTTQASRRDPAALPLPAAEALAASGLLASYIRTQIDSAGGWLPFDAYMNAALFAPGLGYYAGGATKLGAAGDFITAPEMTPCFGQAVSVQVEQIMAHSAPCLLEFGAGSGALARDVLTALEARGVCVERYLIIEPSPQLRERQYETLAALSHIDIQWLNAPPAHFRGAVLANEVLDAMPVKLFLRVASGVLERGVSLNEEGGFEWRDAPATAAVETAVHALEAQLGALPTPYLSEWPLAAQAWAASLAGWLEQGAALLIDYGFPRREFYHPQRSTGTLMCHYRHRAHTDALWLPGLNDITAHVDFSAVAEQGCAQGLEVLGYTAQSHFLINCGLLTLLPAGSATLQATRAAHRLISETEMGELFKVLALGRGLTEPLLGFQRGDRSHTL